MSRLLLGSLLASTFLTAFDATAVIFALPAITADLHGNATESFWITASFLLAMCVAQPVVSSLSTCLRCRSLVLSSLLIMGVGALIGDYANQIALFLVGRSLQGLGAGGLVILTYVTHEDLLGSQASAYLAAIICSVSVGTISGPFVGAVLNESHRWHWLFRANAVTCVLLAILSYRSVEIPRSSARSGSLKNVDYLGAVLMTAAVVPLLAGLSLAGTLYAWNDWRPLLAVAFGSLCLLLFIGREICYPATWAAWPKTQGDLRPLLGFKSLDGVQSAVIFGSFTLGLLIYASMFLLPTYFRIVKHHSKMRTASLVLPQTSMLPPGAIIVAALAKRGFSPYVVALAGWLCTCCGFGLLAMLGAQKPTFSDVILIIPSGFGVGILLPTLSLITHGRQAQTQLVSLRYLGSALGMVVPGIAFQQILRHQLMLTKFQSEATNISKYATILWSSIQQMPSAQDRFVLEHATEKTLRTIWVALSLTSFVVFLLGCVTAITSSRRKQQTSEPQQQPNKMGDDVSCPSTELVLVSPEDKELERFGC